MQFDANSPPQTPNRLTSGATPRVWPVGALCRAVTDALEARFGAVQVQGEIAGFARAASGHCYFTLKDAQGQLRCAMFRRAASLLGWEPRDGEQVQVLGRLAVYEARGDLQLIVESVRRAGQGALYEAFLRIKAELQAQGLFDAARKRTLTPFPRGLGLVTSLGAAALRDVATALQRRAPHLPVLLAPAAVQGAAAPAALIAALQRLYALARAQQQGDATALQLPVIDSILLVRGGGSMDDLWAFNDAQLAHTIVQSPVPLVVGVGHETDFTIADFCADVRAPTPTAAAELAALPRQQLWLQAQGCAQRLHQRVQRQMDALAQQLDRLAWSLSRSAAPVRQHRLHLHELALRLQQLRRAEGASRRQHLQHLRQHLLQASLRQTRHGQHALQLQSAAQALQGSLRHNLQQRQSQLDHLQQRWQTACQGQLAEHSQRLARCANSLRLLNPQHTLQRGFALLQDASGRLLSRQSDFHAGQAITATVSDGPVPLTPQLKKQLTKLQPQQPELDW
ncbi:MAG: exodeoxyribonuclease VII large subunit [Brachymonas sp.]|nr:exodeoxyribonuclease VII large subunit [Brachymonas sp.]